MLVHLVRPKVMRMRQVDWPTVPTINNHLVYKSLRVENVDAFFDIHAIACNKAPLWKKPWFEDRCTSVPAINKVNGMGHDWHVPRRSVLEIYGNK